MSIIDDIEQELTPCPSWINGRCFCWIDCSGDVEEIEIAKEEQKKEEERNE